MLVVGDRFPVEKLAVGGHPVAVVYFYPAALTPGCTLEAKGFNDRYERFRERRVRGDRGQRRSPRSQRRVSVACGLDFPLVSDEGAELTAELGLLKDYGEYGMLARRATLLLDADGVVQRVWDVTDARGDPETVRRRHRLTPVPVGWTHALAT